MTHGPPPLGKPSPRKGHPVTLRVAGLFKAISMGAALLLGQVAAAADAGAVIEALEAKYADVSVMQANFVQTTRSAVFGEEKQTGDVVLKRPSKMKWNFTGDKVFVTDGKTMWIYTTADNQVIKYDDVSAGGGSTADSLLQSLHRLSELFDVILIESTEEGHLLSLSPKQADAKNQFKSVRMQLTPEYVVKGVAIIDPFDNVTELVFTNVRLGGDVPDSTFEFTIPDGAQVITAGM